MREIIGNIWNQKTDGPFWVVIPCNGFWKKDGAAVMGAGVAKEAAELYPGLSSYFGGLLKRYGNIVLPLGNWGEKEEETLISFPTKQHWREPSNLRLIKQSCRQLYELWQETDNPYLITVFLPRVGCGLGGLSWEQVKPVLEKYFVNDQFVIVEKKLGGMIA